MNRGFLEGKRNQDCLMQVLKEKGLEGQNRGQSIQSAEEWVKQDHAEILKVR